MLMITQNNYAMKKITLILMAAFLVIAAGSCNKDETPNNNNNNNNNVNTTNDGVYTPGQKILYCYEWNDWLDSQVKTENWNWNGTKLLSIDHVWDDGTVRWSENYDYQGDRMVRVTNTSNEYTEFSYNGSQLAVVTFCYDYQPEIVITFSYGSDNRVSQAKIKVYDNKALDKDYARLIKAFVPKYYLDRIEKHGGEKEDIDEYTVKFTWVGENLSGVTTTAMASGSNFSVTCVDTYSFTYDGKNNPKKGLLGLYTFEEDMNNVAIYYSKNNLLNCHDTYKEYGYEEGEYFEEEESDDTSFSYIYDAGGFPTQINETVSYSGYSYSNTYFYEYQ